MKLTFNFSNLTTIRLCPNLYPFKCLAYLSELFQKQNLKPIRENAYRNPVVMKPPDYIFHFTPSAHFDKHFLFHQELNNAAIDIQYFNIGQSGYRNNDSRLRQVAAEYWRALKMLCRGFISGDNKQTLVYCHTTKYALPGLLLCRVFRIGQIVYFNHGVPCIGYTEPLHTLLRLLEYINIMVCHHFITVSPSMVKFLNPDATGSPFDHATCPGSSSGLRDTDYLNFSDLKIKCRLHNGNQGVRYCYAGRLEERKGIFFLLTIWQTHISINPSDRLILCGFSGSDLCRSGYKNDLPGIEVRGFIPDMQPVYDEVDVVVSPSSHEGFGYTLLEGAARGCCIISSRIPGPDIMFTSWMQAQLFESSNDASLAEVMFRLSNDQRKLSRGKLLSYRSALRFRSSQIDFPLTTIK